MSEPIYSVEPGMSTPDQSVQPPPDPMEGGMSQVVPTPPVSLGTPGNLPPETLDYTPASIGTDTSGPLSTNVPYNPSLVGSGAPVTNTVPVPVASSSPVAPQPTSKPAPTDIAGPPPGSGGPKPATGGGSGLSKEQQALYDREREHIDRSREIGVSQANQLAAHQQRMQEFAQKQADEQAQKDKVRDELFTSKQAQFDKWLSDQKTSIDPNRAMSNAPMASKFLLVIAAALGGGAQGLGGAKSNAGLDTINHMIEDDIGAQRADMQNAQATGQLKQNELSQTMAHFKDQRLAEDALRTKKWMAADKYLDVLSERFKGETLGEQAAKMKIDLDQNILTQKQKAQAAAAQWAQSRMDTLFKQNLELADANTRRMTAQAALNQADAASQKANGEKNVIYTAKGDSIQIQDPEVYKKIVEAKSGADGLVGVAGRMQKLYDKTGGVLNPSVRDDLNTEYMNAVLSIQKANHLGTYDDGMKALAAAGIGDPTALFFNHVPERLTRIANSSYQQVADMTENGRRR